MEVTITGADKLAQVGRALKTADKGIKREFGREMRAVGRPVGQAIRSAYGAQMPHRGGLASVLGKATVSTKWRTAGNRVGARIDLRAKHELRSIERGQLRHPVYGGDTWVDQSVPAEVGEHAFQKQAPAVRRRMLGVMDRVANQIARSAS